MMSNKHTKVALLFLCQPSFSNQLFLLVTSPHSCPCGVVMSVHAQFMQPMRPSEVNCHHHFIVVLGVCGVVSSITTALSHSLIASSNGCVMCFFFVHNQLCGLLSKCQLTACQPHSLRRERWGLSRYGLKPGRVE